MIDLDWEDTPIRYGSGTTAYTRTAWVFGEPEEKFDTHGLAMVDLNLEFLRADLAIHLDGVWYVSCSSADWPKLNEIFGAGWDDWLAEYEKECLEDMEEEEEI